MIYGFDTSDEVAATAALVLYIVYRSRDRGRFKVTPDMWGQIERFLKDSAKRSQSIPELIEALKSPRHLYASSLHPRYMEVGLAGEIPLTVVTNPDGTFSHAIQFASDRTTGQREFGVRVIERADARAVIEAASRQTAWVVLLVRDRLERERPIDEKLDSIGDIAA